MVYDQVLVIEPSDTEDIRFNSRTLYIQAFYTNKDGNVAIENLEGGKTIMPVRAWELYTVSTKKIFATGTEATKETTTKVATTSGSPPTITTVESFSIAITSDPGNPITIIGLSSTS